MGIFSLLASAPLEKYELVFAGASVAVESENIETFLEDPLGGSLEETFFFFGSVVIEEEEEEADTGF